MPTITVQLESPLVRTFRVEQVAGLFDVPLPERMGHTLTADVPGLEEPWTIGAIVGPSGSGKTTLARAAFGAIYEAPPWPDGMPILECLSSPPTPSVDSSGSDVALSGNDFPAAALSRSERAAMTIKQLARVLTAVGLGSVRTWLKPYRVLSTGERFRADVARAVAGNSEFRRQKAEFGRVGQASPRAQTHAGTAQLPRGSAAAAALTHPTISWPPVVLDEFTSSLDRTIAKTASAALGRLMRSHTLHSEFCILSFPRLVVLTCHGDILPWLAPDWIVELSCRDRPPWRSVGRDGSSLRISRNATEGVGHARNAQEGVPYSAVWFEQPRPPEIPLLVERVPQALWREFAAEHYLTGGLAASATCYAARWDGGADSCKDRPPWRTGQRDTPSTRGSRNATEGVPNSATPLAFCAVVAALGWKKTKRITRLVVRPEFQGLGIGTRLAEAVARIEANKGNRVTITASHPAIVGHCSHSPHWRPLRIKKTGSTRQRYAGREVRTSTGRAVAAFEFVAE